MRTYHIRAGRHYAPHLPKLYFGIKKKFVITVCFKEGCEYRFQGEDSSDVNKLFGVSFGQHHKNSIRIGWNSDGSGLIKLFYYAYENGYRSWSYIGTCKQHESQAIVLELDFNSNSVFITNSTTGSIDSIRTKSIDYKYPAYWIGYYLFPYFGGNRTAPTDVYIQLKID